MTLSVGIDLGTTNSALAIKKLSISVIRNSEGDELTPSCVTATALDQSAADFIVGRDAKDLMKQYPEQTVISVKRLIGRDFDEPEVQKLLSEKRYGYQITTNPSEPGSIEITLGNKNYSPEAISALILKKVAKDGASQLQHEISQAVVTVPAYFSDRQKFATRAACEQAGLKVIRLLPEPTAAAVSFGLMDMGKDEAKVVMVFDLGGGTFDVSVLNIAGGQFMEVTKGGDMWLGGDDVDLLIRDFVFEHTEKKLGCAPIAKLLDAMDTAARTKFIVAIKENCEQAKIQLSCEPEAHVESYGILRDQNGNKLDIDVTITRQDFDALIAPMAARLVAITENILHDIRYEPELVDTVLMVGGSANIPAIQEALRNKFGAHKVKVHDRPMFAVVEGAAVMAHKLSSKEQKDDKTVNLMHSTAHDYYLQLANGQKHRLVERNTPLPIRLEQKLTFAHEKQSMARLRVFNEVDGVLEAVGELWFHKNPQDPLSELPGKSQSANELILRFEIDEDNIIRMQARALGDETETSEAIIARGGLALRLFGDLEKTLSDISHKSCPKAFQEFLQLSKVVSETILLLSDPSLMDRRTELKTRAFAQIATLKELSEKKMTPIYLLRSAKSFHEKAPGAVDEKSQKIIDDIVETLMSATLDLTSISPFISADIAFENLMESDSNTNEIADALDTANQGIVKWPRTSEKIWATLKDLATARKVDDKAGMQIAQSKIADILAEFTDDLPPSNRNHFDRDVRLGSP